MNNWRDVILNNFVPNVSKLTLVADPDCLLTEEKLSMELHQRGFDLIEFKDAIEFRYAYESKYRSIWDSGAHTDLVVILHLQDNELESLPYDLLKAGRKLSFNLGELFPNMSYPVIEDLDCSFLDTLYEAQIKTQSGRMGENLTLDFILLHVFGIAPTLISNEVDLLKMLLRLHYNNTNIPQNIANHLIQVLNNNNNFQAWPLTEIVSDNEKFYSFLQERWPVFVDKLDKTGEIKEDCNKYGLNFSGPSILPFDHQDIRVYIDNLFVEGKLSPIQMPELLIDKNSWILSGIIKSNEENNDVRISRLFDIIEKGKQFADFRYTDWINFALKWAELSALVHCGTNVYNLHKLQTFGDTLNLAFADWLDIHYASLINLPPNNPPMLHHVPRRLVRDIEDVQNRCIALIVIDGLALDQWVTIRQSLHEQMPELIMRESATFAWIPTLTSVSRQAIFSGKIPSQFPSSINNTNSEFNLWKQFWESNMISRLDIAYEKGLNDGDAGIVLDKIINPGKTRVVGLVIDKVDKIMHGMQLGSSGMHNQINQWCQGGFLKSLIYELQNYGFDVWMTSDHGNIESQGKGRPSEGVIADTRGERVRIYPDEYLRSITANNFTFSHEWEPVGLPSNYFPLVASGRNAFVNQGESIVGHGGISIEEVIVPLIKFERRK
jgi:hypothetical protein